MKLVLQAGCSWKCCGILLWAAPTGESAKLFLLQEVLKLLRWATVFGAWFSDVDLSLSSSVRT